MSKADIVIVGGAAMGSSLAYHLLSDPGFDGQVTVIEKDPTYARSASALSAASIRQQFTTPINIDISLYGIQFLRGIGEALAVNGDKPQIDLHEGGYLYLATPNDAPALLRANALQRERGADILSYDRAGLKARFPWLNTDDLAAGSWGRTGEGWFDGWALFQAFRRKARSLGAQYLTDEVVGLERKGRRIEAVQLAGGARLGCGIVIDCAGASGGRQLAAMAGVTIPVYAKKRSVFTFVCREPIAAASPLVIDTSGVWWRPEGDGFICGYSPDDGDETDHATDFEVDWPLFEEKLWPALAHRVPAFEALRPGRAWAGHYDMNLIDHNAIVGPAPECDNLLLCNGFSGHGLQQSPAIGRGLAEWIVHGRYVTLDLSPFAFARLAAMESAREVNVI